MSRFYPGLRVRSLREPGSTTGGNSYQRLEGTEVEEGKKILAESGTAIITANGLTDAAQKVVAASKA